VLLERDGELESSKARWTPATRGRGSVVLVSGEAALGKTSLVRAFLRAAAHRDTVLQGVCDDLLTPRTLAPSATLAVTRTGTRRRGNGDSRCRDGQHAVSDRATHRVGSCDSAQRSIWAWAMKRKRSPR
jgi:predicted ATPase